MPTHKTQSKQAPKAQPYLASLPGDIKRNSTKSPSLTSKSSGAQMPPRVSTSSPSSSTSGASASHHARAASPGSGSASSDTLSRASSVTSEERRNTAAALPLPIAAASSKNGSPGRAPSRATPTALPREPDHRDVLGASRPSDKYRVNTAALSRPLRSHESQVSLNYGASDSDRATPSTATKTSTGEPLRSISRSPRRFGSEDRETIGSRRCYSPREDGECSPPHTRRSSTPAGDFYRPAAYPRSPRGGYRSRCDDDASRRHPHHSTAGEPQRRKADTYRPGQQSPVAQQHGEHIAQEVARSLSTDLNQLQQRRADRPKRIQRDNKGRPILAKYRKDKTDADEEPAPVPKKASARASTKTKKVKTVKDEDDHRRDSGMSLSKSPAALSVSPPDIKASGSKSLASAPKEDAPRRTDGEAPKKPASSKKRARPTEDLNQDGSPEQASKKTKLSKAKIVQENEKSSSTADDISEDADTVAPVRKKLVSKKPAPSKRKTTAEVAEDTALFPAPKVSRKRKLVEYEDSSSSDSSSEDDTPLIQLRPAKKQKEEQAITTEYVSAHSEESSPEEVEETAPKSKAARKATTAKKQQTGIPAEERVKGVAYIKLDDGTYMKQERQRKVGTAKPKAKPKGSKLSRFFRD